MTGRKKHPRCRGKNRDGKRCKKNALPGGHRCAQHPAKKRGRKAVTLTEEQWRWFDAMCSAGAREVDIAEALQVDVDTLSAICKRERGAANFSEYRELKRGKGRAALKAKQFELAMAGNPTMLIWLGKQELDQKEPKQQFGLGGPKGGPVQVRHGISAAQADAIKQMVWGIGTAAAVAASTPEDDDE